MSHHVKYDESPLILDESPSLASSTMQNGMCSTEGNGMSDPKTEIFSKAQVDNTPFLSKHQKDESICEEPEDNLEEMETKYAAYVRRDIYGTMGTGDISIREKALLVLALLTIVPIKVILLFAIVVLYYVICHLCTMFWSPQHNGDEGEEKNADSSSSPLKEEREQNIYHTELLHKRNGQENYANLYGVRRLIIVHAGRFLSRAILFVLGFYWIRVTHRDLEQDAETSKEEETSEDTQLRPGAIVSNHVSYIDILYHMSASFPSFVAKRSVARLPLVGLISKCLGCIYVQREDKPSDFRGVSGYIMDRLRACNRDKNAPPMLLFPEGTTTNGFYLLPFRTGAFLAQTPVQPVILKYPYRRLSPAWDTISGVRHVVLLLCQFINFMEVVWLPVYYPSENEKLDAKLYANNVRKFMAKEAGLVLSDIGLPEKRIYHTYLNDLNAVRTLQNGICPVANYMELSKVT